MYSDNETLEQKLAWFVLPIAIALQNVPDNLRRLWRWARYEVPAWKLLVSFGLSAVALVGAPTTLHPLNTSHPNVAGVAMLLTTLNFYVHLFVVIPVTVRRVRDQVQKGIRGRIQRLDIKDT